jgi:hypothetical protein
MKHNVSESYKESVRKLLWHDLSTRNTPPPLLAHYTRLDTLESIIKNQEIWLSNPLNMSDIEELRFILNEGARLFQEKIADCPIERNKHELIRCFNFYLERFGTDHALHTYVLCMCTHKRSEGLLSMWRAYGDNAAGAAIVIKSSTIPRTNGKTPFYFSSVSYESHSVRTAWLEKTIDAVVAFASAAELDNDSLSYLAHHLVERLKLFAIFNKNDGFSEEDEWRLVFLSSLPGSKPFGKYFHYQVTAKGVVPKLKLPFTAIRKIFKVRFSLEHVIDQILLGPSVSNALAVEATKRMVVMLKHPKLARCIRASEIPYRP